MQKILPIFIIALIVIGGGSFYGGMSYQKSQRGSGRRFERGQNGLPQDAGRFRAGTNLPGGHGLNGGGVLVIGEIIAQDDKSITMKLMDSGSKIVFYSASTDVIKTRSGTTNDLAVGINVTVRGSTNADGSVTAENIQIRPTAPANN